MVRWPLGDKIRTLMMIMPACKDLSLPSKIHLDHCVEGY